MNSITFSAYRSGWNTAFRNVGQHGEGAVCGNNKGFESSNTIIIAQNDEIKNKLINGSYNNLLQPYDKAGIQNNQYKCWIYDGSNLPKLYFEELKK